MLRGSRDSLIATISVIYSNSQAGLIKPPKISSLPSPLKTILTPMALIFLLNRYMGVLARTVVTSYVSRW